MKLSRGLLAVVMVVFAVPVCAQSLGDLAKREAERRKANPTPKKVYTDDDLKKIAVGPAAEQSAPAAAPAQTDASTAEGKAGDAKDAKDAKSNEPDPKKSEAVWRDRMNTARDTLRRNEMFRDALQSRINGLTADFTSRDDPYQRALVADDRQKALAELEQVKKDIETSKKAIGDIEEEARRANVPPGWIR